MIRPTTVCLLLAPLVLAPVPARADQAIRDAAARDYRESLSGLFEHFHRNPELSFREFKTAERLAQELRAAGVEVTTGVGGTGLVGILKNGEGPLVLVRADMDGLPVEERSGSPYASTATQEDIDGETVPVMHACGHDVHMTSLVGTARRLAALKPRWSGTVMFVGQPAEERIGGARAMLDDRLYERFGVPDFALAFHVSANRPAGKVSLSPGLIYSSSDSVNITVRGVGAHGASPHKGKDPIYVASQIVVALQGLVSRELSPLEPGVVTVGAFHGGFKHNIIPDAVKLQLTVRADSEQTRARLLDGVKRIAEGVARTAGLPEDLLPIVDLSLEATPITVNDDALVRRLNAVFVRELGPENMFDIPRDGMGAEDFAYFVQTEHQVPGAYFQVGGTDPADIAAGETGGPQVPSHHSPFFKIEPEPAVITGIHATTVAVLDLLAK